MEGPSAVRLKTDNVTIPAPAVKPVIARAQAPRPAGNDRAPHSFLAALMMPGMFRKWASLQGSATARTPDADVRNASPDTAVRPDAPTPSALAKPAAPAPQPRRHAEESEPDDGPGSEVRPTPVPRPGRPAARVMGDLDDEHALKVAHLKELIARESLTSQEIRYTRGLMDALQLRPDPRNPRQLIAMNERPMQLEPVQLAVNLMANLIAPQPRHDTALAHLMKPRVR